jgi:hypothetical protein
MNPRPKETHTSIVARWRNNFSQRLNVHRVNVVRDTEINTEEQLVPETSAFEVKLAIETIKRHNSTCISFACCYSFFFQMNNETSKVTAT